jgi:hypothetical protein
MVAPVWAPVLSLLDPFRSATLRVEGGIAALRARDLIELID